MPESDVIDEDLFADMPADTVSDHPAMSSTTNIGIPEIVPEIAPEEGVDPVKVDENLSGLPQLVGTDFPEGYKAVVDRFLKLYANLPRIDYNDLHAEISDLNVDSSPTPTLQLINLKLQKIQASKDRLAEIYQQVIRCYTFKKRAVNILSEASSKFTEGKNQDKRQAESSFRLCEFHADLAQVEALYNVCEHVLRNLDSQSHAISRQITIIQSELKLFEMGRSSLPDFDFNKKSLNEGFESLGDSTDSSDISNEIDPKESQKAEEMSF